PVNEPAKDALAPHFASLTISRLGPCSVGINMLRAGGSGKPFQAGYYYNAGVASAFRDFAAEIGPDVVYFQLARTAWYARGLKAPCVLDLQDAFSAGLERRAQGSRWYQRPVLREEYRRMLRYERQICQDFPFLSIISEADRALLPCADAERILVVPNGVDTDHFRPKAYEKRYDLVFTGNMGYPPNVDAARFLASELMPRIWALRPQARLLIAGAQPHPSVRALSSDRVNVSGWMEDIREAYASSRVFIAPMRLGTGMQNKILEAMAMGLPCVTTPLANAPLGSTHGQEILVGEDAATLSGHILRLLSEDSLAEPLANAARAYVKRHYSWEGATAPLERMLIAAAGQDGG
ncbi:MAG TPA: glycosyltransferase, partial [Bacteroidales bacterium]|nr:glycosyltransferase [Bacteroidales bacterium]